MANTPKLTPDQAFELKRMMYEGAKYADLQIMYDVSYQTVVGIKGGRFYGSVPWPDGNIGAMPKVAKSEDAPPNKYGKVLAGGVNTEQERPIATKHQIEELNAMARQNGFPNIGAMLEFNKHVAIKERMEREVEEQRLKSLAYEESERIRMLPENVEARRLAAKEPERQDIIDPKMQDKYTWEEILELTHANHLVQVADGGKDPALQMAIRIAFKLFRSTQWGQQHVLVTVYDIRKKIEKYWDEHSDERPEEEQTAL